MYNVVEIYNLYLRSIVFGLLPGFTFYFESLGFILCLIGGSLPLLLNDKLR